MDGVEFDHCMMDSCLKLAMRGRGRVEPNPMVGCVITHEQRIIGQGFHEQFGAPHAEPNAMEACIESPRGGSAFVTLEPCCHNNKKTPPCVPRLIEAGIARVIVGCVDPNPAVSGQGISQLRSAKIQVDVGVREAQAKQLVAPFFCYTQLHRPYVTLKWAQDPTGSVGTRGISRQWISSPRAGEFVHQLRARCDAILVGINTVRADDPSLTVRGTKPLRPLLRAVLDCNLSITMESRLAQSAREHPLVVYCNEASLVTRKQHAAELGAAGVEVIPVPIHDNALDLHTVLSDLHQRAVTHLLVEPGPTLARSFIGANLADRAFVIYGAKRLRREANSIDATPMPFHPVGEITIDSDRVVEFLNQRSEAFFASKTWPEIA